MLTTVFTVCFIAILGGSLSAVAAIVLIIGMLALFVCIFLFYRGRHDSKNFEEVQVR